MVVVTMAVVRVVDRGPRSLPVYIFPGCIVIATATIPAPRTIWAAFAVCAASWIALNCQAWAYQTEHALDAELFAGGLLGLATVAMATQLLMRRLHSSASERISKKSAES